MSNANITNIFKRNFDICFCHSRLVIVLLLMVNSTFTYSQIEATTKDSSLVVLYDNGSWQYADSIPLYGIIPLNIKNLEIPKINKKDKITTHAGYSLLYNEKHEQANWVAYNLTANETNKIYERTNDFNSDPLIKSRTADDKDYYKSGYDRGHLAPASDMGWSSTAMIESFYYSNISPQNPGFNRGVWKKLEDRTRIWAVENNNLYIITGPILADGLQQIGANKVSVPNYFYKVILDYTAPSVKGIGFIIANNSSSEALTSFAVSIDAVENMSGIDFFPLLPDDQENLIESTICIDCWTWSNTKKENDKEKLSESVRCKGITKAGEQCKNKTLNPSGYCFHHEDQINEPKTETKKNSNQSTKSESVQCSGTTKAGVRCKRMTTSTNGRCYQH